MTVPQHLQALGKANEVRFGRVRLRQEIRALPPNEARARIADLLDQREPFIQSMRIVDLLTWPRRAQLRMAHLILNAIQARDDRLVRQLTGRQIEIIRLALLNGGVIPRDAAEYARRPDIDSLAYLRSVLKRAAA